MRSAPYIRYGMFTEAATLDRDSISTLHRGLVISRIHNYVHDIPAMSLEALEGETFASYARRTLTNFHAEGEKVIQACRDEAFSNGNAIYEREGGVKLWVGSADLASDRAQLAAIECQSIVFCQDESEGSMYFADEPGFRYLAFPIGLWEPPSSWPNVVPGDMSPTTPTPEALLAYFRPLFDFVSSELSEGRNVLIHCLAGAHRAGSAGIACLMQLEGLSLAAATARAKAARPVIDPIHYLYCLLTQLEDAMNSRR